MKVIAVHALIIFSGKIGFGHSITCNKKNCFYTEKLFYINFLCTRRVLQIFIGNSYPTDGQLLCATVNFQYAFTKYCNTVFFSFLKSPPFRVGRHIVFSPGVCLSVTKCVPSIT